MQSYGKRCVVISPALQILGKEEFPLDAGHGRDTTGSPTYSARLMPEAPPCSKLSTPHALYVFGLGHVGKALAAQLDLDHGEFASFNLSYLSHRDSSSPETVTLREWLFPLR